MQALSWFTVFEGLGFAIDLVFQSLHVLTTCYVLARSKSGRVVGVSSVAVFSASLTSRVTAPEGSNLNPKAPQPLTETL